MNKPILFILLLANFFYANAATRMFSYRWRNDNGNETTATWKAALNTPLKINNFDPIRIRIVIDKDGVEGSSLKFRPDILFSVDGTNWIDFEDANSPFKYVNSSLVVNGKATTQQIGTNDPVSFIPGSFVSDNSTAETFLPDGINVFTEYEFCFKPNSLISPGLTYKFKVFNTMNNNIPELTYCTTPKPTVSTTQNLNANATVSDLLATGDDLKWYNLATGGQALDLATALSTGFYYVTQTATCESDRVEVQVNIGTLSVDENNIDFNASVKVYPNPSTQEFFIDSKSEGILVLFDLLGKTIYSGKMNSGTTKLDLDNSPKGIYLVKVTNENKESKTFKLVKN